nr:hypothetical protein [Candidatus Njordarchaeota archaeon]
MEWKLVDEGLTPKEVRKALSLARAKQEVGMLYPPKRELCYQLLTEEERKLQNRLITAVKQVFNKTKKQFCKVDEMKQLLIEENLTPEEAEQAISLAQANDVMRKVFPYTHEIDGEPSYELLTEEELVAQEKEELEELEKEYQRRKKKERTDKKTKKERR